MATTIQKITLSGSRDIPFNKLVLSQAKRPAREGRRLDLMSWPRTSPGARCLQGLSVRAVVDADGNETGMFEVPAGGRPLPGTRIAGQAEAPGQNRVGALRRARRWDR